MRSKDDGSYEEQQHCRHQKVRGPHSLAQLKRKQVCSAVWRGCHKVMSPAERAPCVTPSFGWPRQGIVGRPSASGAFISRLHIKTRGHLLRPLEVGRGCGDGVYVLMHDT